MNENEAVGSPGEPQQLLDNAQAPTQGTLTLTSRAALTLVPRTIEEAMSLARVMAVADVIPAPLRNRPSNILAILLTGMELGFTPMQAMRAMHIVQGRVVLTAEAMVALVRRSSQCVYFRCVETNDKIATYETLRRGYPAPTRMSFSVEDAERAGLLGKDNWRLYRAAMLRARAASALCRSEYSDVLLGVYGQDEISVEVVDQASFYAAAGSVIDAEFTRDKDKPPAKNLFKSVENGLHE